MCEEKNKKNKNLCKITQVLNSKAATQLQPVWLQSLGSNPQLHCLFIRCSKIIGKIK